MLTLQYTYKCLMENKKGCGNIHIPFIFGTVRIIHRTFLNGT